jgi:hypothetical protein
LARPFRGTINLDLPCGEGLCIGYDGGDPVSREYPHRFEFREGRS